MTEWTNRYNYPLLPLSNFESYDDRIANFKYGFIKVNFQGDILNGIVFSPNGNKHFEQYFHNKLDSLSNILKRNQNLELTIDRLKINDRLSQYWIVFGKITCLKQLHEQNTLCIFSKFGLKNLPSELEIHFK